MGFLDSVKNAGDTIRKVKLQSPAELEELLGIITGGIGAEKFGAPEIKRGITGKAIVFPKLDRVTPSISVKGDTVTISKIVDSSSSKMSVGGMGIRLDKDMRGKNAVSTMDSGSDYFKAVADAVTAALAGR